MGVADLLLSAVASAVAAAGVITVGTRYIFRGRARLLSGDGGSPALRAMTTVYALSLAFVLATSLQSFQSTSQQTNAEAYTVVALGNLSHSLPSPNGDEFRTALVSYAKGVINREFPAMASRQFQPLDDNAALLTLYRALPTGGQGGASEANTPVVQEALQQLSNLTTERDARIRAAKATLPALVWVLIAGGGVIVLLGVAAVTFIDRPWPQFFVVSSVAVIFAVAALIIVSLETPFVNNGFVVSDQAMRSALATITL
jgi:hypothetical protein